MKTQIKAWKPVENIPKTLHFEKLSQGCDGFQIVLRAENKKESPFLQISFPYTGYIKFRHGADTKKYIDYPNLDYNWPLHLGYHTPLVNWIIDQACGLTVQEGDIEHVIILTPTYIVQIFPTGLPEVEWISSYGENLYDIEQSLNASE